MPRLALLGDVMLGRLVNESLRGKPPSAAWGDVLALLRESDWRFCNLECVISDLLPERLPAKVFHFRSDARNVAVLRAAGIDTVSCANNHSLDFGPAAMLDMLRLLDAAGVGHAGAGADLEQASRAAFSTTRDGTRIAVLACTDNEPGWAAGADSSGIWYVPADPGTAEARLLLQRVSSARRLADIVVVSLHWGSNWGRRPEAGHLELARALIRAGADLIFGHSSHVFRGVGLHSGVPIIYAAGDFIDDYGISEAERNNWSMLHVLEMAQPTRRLHLHATLIDRMRARLAHGEEAATILSLMASLCSELGTSVRQAGGQLLIELGPRAPYGPAAADSAGVGNDHRSPP
jgi:poly-gamma-glutamate synthesis protein (capsule biosynthesis protein)